MADSTTFKIKFEGEDNTDKAAKSVESNLSSIEKTAKHLGEALLAAFAVDQIVEYGRELTEIAEKYGKLSASLNTVTGSAEEAAAAFDQIRQFQANAPIFSVEEITHAFVQLKNLGLDPANESLRSYGNIAAGTGKSIAQFIEAIADAASGSGVERIAEFGIKLRNLGDTVSIQFRGTTEIVDNSASAISAALQKIGNTTFAKGIENQSKEIAGSLGKVRQAYEDLSLVIADSAPIQGISEGLANLLKGIKDVAVSQGGISGKTSSQLQELHDALILQINASEKWGARNLIAERQLLAVNEALSKLKSSANKPAEVEIKLPSGLLSDADKLITRFEALKNSGKDVAQSLSELGSNIKPEGKNFLPFVQALERLKDTGKATGGEIKDAIEGATKDISDSGLKSLSAVFLGLKDNVKETGAEIKYLNDAIDIVLRESLKRLGLDADQALGGISQPVANAITDIDSLATALEAAGTTAEASGEIISKAIEKAIPKATTVGELDALAAQIEAFGKDGTLSVEQLAEAEAELAIQLRTVEEQEAKNNAVLQEAVRTQSEAVAVAERETTAVERQTQGKVDEARLRYDVAKASGNEKAAAEALLGLKAAEAAQSEAVAKAKADEAETAKAYLGDIIAEAEADGTLTEAEQALIDKAQEVADAKVAEADAAKTTAAEKEIEAAATDKLTKASKDNADASNDSAKATKTTSDAVTEFIGVATDSVTATKKINAVIALGIGGWEEYAAIVKIATDANNQLAQSLELQGKLEAAASSGRGLEDALRAAGGEAADLQSKFDLLDQNQLSGLQSALDSVKSKLESIRDSAKAALLEQQKEANTLAGNEAANQALDDEAKLADLKQQLQEAANAGDSQSVADLKKAIALLEQNIAARKEQADQAERTAAADQQSADATKQSTDNVSSRTSSESSSATSTSTDSTSTGDKKSAAPRVTPVPRNPFRTESGAEIPGNKEILQRELDNIDKYKKAIKELKKDLEDSSSKVEKNTIKEGIEIFKFRIENSKSGVEQLKVLIDGGQQAAVIIENARKSGDASFLSAVKADREKWKSALDTIEQDRLTALDQAGQDYATAVDEIIYNAEEANKSIDQQIADIKSEGKTVQENIKAAKDVAAEAFSAAASGSIDEAKKLRDELTSTADSLKQAGKKDEAIAALEDVKKLNTSIAEAEKKAEEDKYNEKVKTILSEAAEKIKVENENYLTQLKHEEELHKKRLENIHEENAARNQGQTPATGATTGSGGNGSSGGGGGSSGGGGGSGGGTASDDSSKGGARRSYATGAILPGYGGGDRRHALLEDGEAVIPKESVARYRPAVEALISGKVAAYAGGFMPDVGRQNRTALGIPDIVLRVENSKGKADLSAPRDSATASVLRQLQKDLAKR